MSVLMMLSMRGDPRKLEEYAAGHPDGMREIIESAKGHGMIAHRFYGSEDGQIMVIDEWPDAESFLSFFDHVEAEVGEMMGAVGVTGQPEPKFWHELESHDKYGWDA